ncbi:hypothetical protein [Flavobacterium sp.]|uniref:hypothetical protein n=1 Tax=Flavobacterium sp. TaxID=239 RepID=UPI0035277BBF
MKNFIYLIFCFGCGILAVYEQSKPEPNKFIMFLSFAVFVFGMYKLMKTIPSKNTNNDEE